MDKELEGQRLSSRSEKRPDLEHDLRVELQIQDHRKAPALLDVEKQTGLLDSSTTSHEQVETAQPQMCTLLYSKYRPFFHLTIWLLFTSWWIAGLLLHYNDKNWIVPFLLWLCITLRTMSLHVSISVIWKPVKWTWNRTIAPPASYIPKRFCLPIGAMIVITVIITGAFATKETGKNTIANRAVSLFGLAVFVFGLWVTSRNRQKIKWRTVIVGMLIQFLIALFVLRTSVDYDIFHFVSNLAGDLLGYAGQGTIFVTEPSVETLGWFLITVVPTIIFFVALIQLLYHYSLIQWFVGKFAVFFWWSMGVSGAEAVAAAACPFIGQGENAVLIKPFLPHLTNAEIHQVMCSGFGTIAGSVLGAYIGLGINPQALVSSCVMSIPASLAFSHLRYPEEEERLTGGAVIIPVDEERKAVNALHALANGAWLGLKVAGMIVAILICIIALLGLVDGLLSWWGSYLNLNGEYALTVELIVGYICYPVAFLLGVPRDEELLLVGRLIGMKIVTNEFVAYTALSSQPEYIAMSQRSELIATYALCGFGNIAAVGTQVGVFTQIAPSRSGDVSKVAVSALLTGMLSTLSSASIAGMLVTDQSNYT